MAITIDRDSVIYYYALLIKALEPRGSCIIILALLHNVTGYLLPLITALICRFLQTPPAYIPYRAFILLGLYCDLCSCSRTNLREAADRVLWHRRDGYLPLLFLGVIPVQVLKNHCL